MFKPKLKILILMISLTGFNVFAQSTLFQTSSTPKTQTPIPGTSKVMTPQEFQSHVKDVSQQNQDQAQKQATDILQKMLPPPPTETATGTNPAQPKTPIAPTATPTTENNAFPPENEKPNIQKTEMPSGLPSAEPAPGTAEPSSSSGSGSSSSSSSGSAPPSSQGYTGFQGSTPAAPQQPTSGGWSIKY